MVAGHLLASTTLAGFVRTRLQITMSTRKAPKIRNRNRLSHQNKKTGVFALMLIGPQGHMVFILAFEQLENACGSLHAALERFGAAEFLPEGAAHPLYCTCLFISKMLVRWHTPTGWNRIGNTNCVNIAISSDTELSILPKWAHLKPNGRSSMTGDRARPFNHAWIFLEP